MQLSQDAIKQCYQKTRLLPRILRGSRPLLPPHGPKQANVFPGKLALQFLEFISKYCNFVRNVATRLGPDSFQTTGLVRRCQPMIPVCVIQLSGYVTAKGNPYLQNTIPNKHLDKKLSLLFNDPYSRQCENWLPRHYFRNYLI